ncbi:sigma-70 family RNA polymerase sigma factor [Saccharothrix algeriensis]|uniref:RNA polymerase sigma-70 factor (ECF subfamily) n=2 Tax=Saccharothrix algeriensis TaxID=173560 RepID=A0ABS2S5P9_9PSEU|nr:sigma-70 family RNA polymerase sigma factor [Saccharothrix algeriensis]MBM7811234.1 RNA polymerase sigma-70 factor (ECF subfamily) [Saccharothrix algeriensis]
MTGGTGTGAQRLSQRNRAMLLLRLYSLLRQRQETDPDPQRQVVIERLRPLRDEVARGADPHEAERTALDPALEGLVDYLRLIESSSLGTDQAQTNRLLSSPAEIDDVLRRSPLPPPTTTPSGPGPTRPGADDLEELVEAASRGEVGAGEALVSAIRPLLLRYCRARMGRGERLRLSPEEVADEVCRAVLVALPAQRHQHGSFLALAYGVAAHRIADARHSSARGRARSAPDRADGAGDEWEAVRRALAEVLSGSTGQSLNALPERQREILVLRVVVGLSAEETAEAVGSTPGAVRVAQHRALVRLRKVLGGSPGSGAVEQP